MLNAPPPPVGYLVHAWYTTDVLSPHGPRTGQDLTGARGHGLGRSWKLSWSANGPVGQEIDAYLFAQYK